VGTSESPISREKRRNRGPNGHAPELAHQKAMTRRRERKVTYGPDVDEVLTLSWETLDYICPERLTDNVVEPVEILTHHDVPPTVNVPEQRPYRSPHTLTEGGRDLLIVTGPQHRELRPIS
jgi:hypothetical protein